MKPKNTVIAFDTPDQLDRILTWAYANRAHWHKSANLQTIVRRTLDQAVSEWQSGHSHALCIDSSCTIYQASLGYFKSRDYYASWKFTHANDLCCGIDCTIPEGET